MPAIPFRKLLLDENLSRVLLAVVDTGFPGSSHVAYVNLITSEDKAVWEFAKREGFCIVTKDWDYKFMSVRYGCPPKVIRLNCGNKTTTFIADLLRQKMAAISEFLEEAGICYLEIG